MDRRRETLPAEVRRAYLEGRHALGPLPGDTPITSAPPEVPPADKPRADLGPPAGTTTGLLALLAVILSAVAPILRALRRR